VVRNSTLPALISLIAETTSVVTCRSWVGHQALGTGAPCLDGRQCASCRAWRSGRRTRFQFSFWIFSTSLRRRRTQHRLPWPRDVIARSDDRDDLRLAQPVRKNDVRGPSGQRAWVDAETHGQVDGLVELGVLGLLEEGTARSGCTDGAQRARAPSPDSLRAFLTFILVSTARTSSAVSR